MMAISLRSLRPVDAFMFARPSFALVDLIDVEVFAVILAECFGGLEQSMVREIHIVSRCEQRLIDKIGILDMLQEERGLADAAEADGANMRLSQFMRS